MLSNHASFDSSEEVGCSVRVCGGSAGKWQMLFNHASSDSSEGVGCNVRCGGPLRLKRSDQALTEPTEVIGLVAGVFSPVPSRFCTSPACDANTTKPGSEAVASYLSTLLEPTETIPVGPAAPETGGGAAATFACVDEGEAAICHSLHLHPATAKNCEILSDGCKDKCLLCTKSASHYLQRLRRCNCGVIRTANR